MLRKIRIILASVFFIGVTLLFLDFTGTIHAWLGWMAKVQFLPALLAMNFGVVAVLLVLTLLFGRVYCSVICPLGVMQDIISWIHGKTKKKNRFRFSYSPAKNILRYVVLAVFILASLLGFHSFVALIAPYSAYGRIASNLLAPVYQWSNNFFAWMAEEVEKFWREHIIDKKEPAATEVSDILLKYPKHLQGQTLLADTQLLLAYEELVALKKEKGEAEKRIKELEDEFKMAMGECESVTTSDGKTLCTWKASADSVTFDAKALQKAEPDIYERYQVAKAGTRRFLLK